MMKKLGYHWKSWWRSLHNNNYFIIKLGISVFWVSLAFKLVYNRSSDFSPVSDAPFLENTQLISQEITHHIPPKEDGTESMESEGQCSLFSGDWVPHKEEPLYTYESCSWVETHQNCMKNGRPDSGYLYWKWKPRGCELPRPNLGKFLELMRNKQWGFIGDSITRNHVQSLLCVLSLVEKAIEVYHDENYQNRRWAFPSYNFTISVIWSPFLAKAVTFEDMNGVSTSEIELHLDILDKKWTEQYKSFDYVIFSVGKWFSKNAIYFENNTAFGCYNCSTGNFTDIGFGFAYRKVIRNVFNYIFGSKPKGTIFFRASTPDHFEGGEWFTGGTCKREVPVKEGEFELNKWDKVIREVEVEEFGKISVKASENGVSFRLFDVHPLSLMRPDGHPGPYRFDHPFANDPNATVINDCLHWCLPGPIDSWNDVLLEMILNG